jgi:hypothetical protein
MIFSMKIFKLRYFIGIALWAGAAAAQTPPANVTTTAAAATAPASDKMPARTSLDPKPAPGAVALPAAANTLLSGYNAQAQEGLILVYFASGTLADGLLAGSVSNGDARRNADSYLTLAKSARDDLRQVRAAYILDAAGLSQLDRLVAAYGDVIPMIEATKQMADAPTDATIRANFQTARRKAFATMGALFNWQ